MRGVVPRVAGLVATGVFTGTLVLLLIGFRNDYCGGSLPAPRCRVSADCEGRAACRRDGRCGPAGRLRLGVRVPSGGGQWRWVHVWVRDGAGELADRVASFPLKNGRATVEFDELPEGRFAVELHGSPRDAVDEPCAGDLRQTLELKVENGIVRLGGGGRGGTLVNLVRPVREPPCSAAPLEGAAPPAGNLPTP